MKIQTKINKINQKINQLINYKSDLIVQAKIDQKYKQPKNHLSKSEQLYLKFKRTPTKTIKQIANENQTTVPKLRVLMQNCSIIKPVYYPSHLRWKLAPLYQKQGYAIFGISKRQDGRFSRGLVLHWTNKGQHLIQSLLQKYNFSILHRQQILRSLIGD